MFFKKIPDFIGIYDGALSSNQCEEIIDYINSSDLVIGRCAGGEVIQSQKDCFEMGMDVTDNNIVNKYIINSLTKYTPIYRKEYPEVDTQYPWDICGGYNLQRYNPGQGYFSAHCENDCLETSNRMLVWMFYLNTVKDGGGTRFQNYDRITNAVEGRLVIWPASWTHVHHGIVSKTESKYIATGWYAFNEPRSE